MKNFATILSPTKKLISYHSLLKTFRGIRFCCITQVQKSKLTTEISSHTVPIPFFFSYQSIQKLLQAFHRDKGLQPQTPPCKISQVCFTMRSFQLEVEPALDHLTKDIRKKWKKVKSKRRRKEGGANKGKRKESST